MNSNELNPKLPVALGCDHAGYQHKEWIKAALLRSGWQVLDEGAHSEDSVDYPDFAHAVSRLVEGRKAAAGILICGSGNGVCMTANKYSGVRAALCWDDELAILARQHNDANVLCLPARFVDKQLAGSMTELFLKTPFEGGRHSRRVEKIEK